MRHPIVQLAVWLMILGTIAGFIALAGADQNGAAGTPPASSACASLCPKCTALTVFADAGL